MKSKKPAESRRRPTPANAPAAPVAVAPQRPSSRLVGGLTVFVIVFSAIGYGLLGNHDGWSAGPADSVAARANPGHDGDQFEAMAVKLAARLQERPDDADGWLMLARTYTFMQRFSDAVPAFRRVAELRPKDAGAYADWADALAMLNGRNLEGEPEKLIAKALAADPDHVKALSLAGTVAFNRGDAKDALKHWERALRAAPPDSDVARRLQGVVAEARERAGLPAAKSQPAAAGGPGVSGEVTLAAGVKSQVSPDDAVFVFAKANDGSKAPLAIVRTTVRDLPYRFTLDDRSAMNPETPLSRVKTVVVGARVSKTGDVMPRAGDLQGFSLPVQLGRADVRVEIGEAIR